MHDATKSLFTCHKLRCTKQRELVYNRLAATDTHPTAEELYQSILETDEHALSRATVYNSLDALVSAGLCRRISPETGPARFDADTSTHHHVVTEDGRVLDVPHALRTRIPAELPAQLIREIEAALGVSINRVSLTLHAEAKQGQDPN